MRHNGLFLHGREMVLTLLLAVQGDRRGIFAESCNFPVKRLEEFYKNVL